MDSQTEENGKLAFAQGNVQRGVVPYLEAKLADVKDMIVISPKDQVERLQGRAQELKDLIQFAKRTVS